jgi:predicted acyl esterase
MNLGFIAIGREGMRKTIIGSVTAVLISFSYLPARAANPYAVTYERDTSVVMRDGIKLYADVFRPDADGKFPVLLQRTPYDKNKVRSLD